MKTSALIRPQWPAPPNIESAVTTRGGGYGSGPWSSFNLGDHVGDDPDVVAANRGKLAAELRLTRRPVWLTQVHGTDVLNFDPSPRGDDVSGVIADAACTRTAGVPCVILTADCLPVLLCDRQGTVVAAAHAGWRGLAAGILRNTVASMACESGDILAWLGPAIGPDAFEVGEEVEQTFRAEALDARHRTAIGRCFTTGTRPGKYFGDLYALARAELSALGVKEIYGGGFCTFRERDRFFSYRRDGQTGRMASLIWLAP